MSSAILLTQTPSLHLELAIRWGWLTVSARTGCLLIPDAGIASTYDHAQLFFVGAGNRTQVHMLVWLSSWPQRMLLLLFSPLFLWTWVWHTLNAGKPQTRSFSWTAKFSETKGEKKIDHFVLKKYMRFPANTQGLIYHYQVCRKCKIHALWKRNFY